MKIAKTFLTAAFLAATLGISGCSKPETVKPKEPVVQEEQPAEVTQMKSGSLTPEQVTGVWAAKTKSGEVFLYAFMERSQGASAMLGKEFDKNLIWRIKDGYLFVGGMDEKQGRTPITKVAEVTDGDILPLIGELTYAPAEIAALKQVRKSAPSQAEKSSKTYIAALAEETKKLLK